MTLPNFLKDHQSKLKSNKSLIVRDLDETEKNIIVAYVDDGNNSFDVQIVFDSKKNIKQTTCDCENGGICNHIVALAHFISEKKTEKTVLKKVIKKKLSETDLLLEKISNDDLRIWISEILTKNKEFAFVFKNHFVSNTEEVTIATIEKTIQESIASIIGKRKKCETNEVKKIVDALNVSLKPYFNVIFSKVNKENYNLLKHIIFKLEEFNYDYYLTSNRILKLVENLYDLQLKNLFNIKDFEEWQNATRFYLNLIFEEKFFNNELVFIQKIYDFSKANELQKKFIVSALENNFQTLYKDLNEEFLINFEIESFYLTVFLENNLIEKYIHKFKPRRFKNEHNLVLIHELIKINNTDLSEKYCLQQIDGNYKQEYDIPYVKVLISIYKNKNESQKLANILSDYGKYIYTLEDYLFIKENASIEKFKKYRQSVLTNARYAYQSGNIEAFDFYFEIKKLDGKQNDLFEMLNNSHKLEFVNKYKAIAHQLNEINFIKTITNMSFYGTYYKEDLNEIIDYILTKIEKTNLKFYLKNVRPYFSNPIYSALEGNLYNLP